MKIVEFDGRGRKIETDSRSVAAGRQSHLAPRPNLSVGRGHDGRGVRSDVQLYMFQTGILRTKTKYIKMNQGEGDFEIPVPWFLIKHPKGNVVIDGGNAVEAALDKRAHWGAVVDAYDPIMDPRDNCVDQCRSVGVRPEDVRFVVQSHLHLDHTGAIGRFPRAEHIVQRIEYEYAYDPDWFSAAAYIRADFDRPNLSLEVPRRRIHRSFRSVRRRRAPHDLHAGPFARASIVSPDAAQHGTHPSYDRRGLHDGPLGGSAPSPGSSRLPVDAVHSVAKLRKIAADTNALLVTGHDPDLWRTFRKAPSAFYD